MSIRIRCEKGEWKHRQDFSQNQLQRYDRNVLQNRASPASSGIRCTEHSGSNARERMIECEGPCGRERALRYFSKSTRRNGKYVSILAPLWYDQFSLTALSVVHRLHRLQNER